MPSPGRRKTEPLELVQGIRAGLAVWTKRPDDIERIVFSRAARPDIDPLLRWASSRPVECVAAGEQEMDRIAASKNHEGLLIACTPRRWSTIQELALTLSKSRGTAVALERVRNPYNVGGILRTAAYFGVDAVILGAPAPHPGLPPLATRVAEGGAEHVLLGRTTDLADTLSRLRSAGITVIGAHPKARTSVFDCAWPRPAILVLGHEREGLGERVRDRCDLLVCAPGTGAIDSLNVSVAAGVITALMLGRPRPSRVEPLK